jgi:hypothetical protein
LTITSIDNNLYNIRLKEENEHVWAAQQFIKVPEEMNNLTSDKIREALDMINV